jgi:hypothetical protein
MTEEEWLSCDHPALMLNLIRGKSSERKLRLFACACCRSVWSLLNSALLWHAVEIGEGCADRLIDEKEIDRLQQEMWISETVDRNAQNAAAGAVAPPHFLSQGWFVHAVAALEHERAFQEAVRRGERRLPPDIKRRSVRALMGLFRDVFVNPFRPVVLDPRWQTPLTVDLAEAAYQQRILPVGHLDPVRLAVLSDAIEETGCADQTILGHLRTPGPHVRGCWLVDALLSKE